jgi:hypothetical protein
MKALAQVFLTAGLVALGLALYDQVLRPERAAEPATPAATSARAEEPAAPAERPADVPASFPLLEGRGDDYWREAMERRLQAIESRLAAAGKPESDDPAGGKPSTQADAPDDATPATQETSGDTDGATATIRPEELHHFRELLQAVERQRQIEKAVAGIHTFLDKLGVKLTDEERNGVVRTTLEYQAKWREASKTPPADDEQKQQRKDAYQTLFAEYEQALRDQIPTAEADLIMNGIRQATQNRGSR